MFSITGVQIKKNQHALCIILVEEISNRLRGTTSFASRKFQLSVAGCGVWHISTVTCSHMQSWRFCPFICRARHRNCDCGPSQHKNNCPFSTLNTTYCTKTYHEVSDFTVLFDSATATVYISVTKLRLPLTLFQYIPYIYIQIGNKSFETVEQFKFWQQS